MEGRTPPPLADLLANYDAVEVEDGVVEYTERETVPQEANSGSDYPQNNPPSTPPLTREMLERVRDILRNCEGSEDPIVSGFDPLISMTWEDINVFQPDGWLHDLQIDFYLRMIQERNNREGSPLPKIYVFDSIFYTFMSSVGLDYVKDATGEVDIFQFDLLIIPVHYRDHWVLIVADFRDKTLCSYDSMGRDNQNHLDNVAKYLLDEHRRKHRGPADSGDMGGPVLNDDWLIAAFGGEDVPQQNNGSDCGIFCLQFAEHISRDRPFEFDSSHVPYFRIRMMYETLTKTLLTTQ